MIHPLRTAHRRVFLALALVLPAVIVIGLSVRHPQGHPRVRMVELPASARLVRMSNTLWSKSAIKTAFYEDSTRPGEIFVVLCPTAELTEPDILVYWSQEQPAADFLPAQAALAGPFRANQPLALPTKSDLPGYLILFSLPHHMMVDIAKVEKLP